MTIRKLAIEPFKLVGQSNPEVTVTVSMVGSEGSRISGIVVVDGSAVIDRSTRTVHQETVTLDIYPQPDIEPVINYGSSADQREWFYLVDVVHKATRYHHQFRTQVADGPTELSWAEFAAGQGPLSGGEISAWQTHIADSGIHVPPGGLTGQSLVKASDTDGDTEWFDPPDVHTLDDYGETAQAFADGGAMSVNISLGQSVELTLTANAVSFNILNPSVHAATSFSLMLVTGGFDVTAWTDVSGWFGVLPDLSSGGMHGFHFELVGGSWYGTHKGQVIT